MTPIGGYPFFHFFAAYIDKKMCHQFTRQISKKYRWWGLYGVGRTVSRFYNIVLLTNTHQILDKYFLHIKYNL